MPEDPTTEELAKLQKKLYRRDIQFTEKRSALNPVTIDPRTTSWHGGEGDLPMALPAVKKFPLVNLILVVAVVFFVGAIGLAAVQYFSGLTLVSSSNIDLGLTGSEKVNAGEAIQLSVVIANRNQKDLTATKLVMTFPDGTRDALDPTKTLKETRETIGDIASGQAITKVFKAILYGQEKDEKEIVATLEYRIAGSNATLTKTEKFHVAIGSSPVRVTAAAPDEVNSGQPFELKVEVTANAQNTVSDLALVVNYPPGFTFAKADPMPDAGGRVWHLANLAAGQTATIRIQGQIQAQADETKAFQVSVGTLADPADLDLALEYNNLFEAVAIKRPFVDLTFSISGSPTTDAIDSTKIVPIEINWRNTLPVAIRDAEIKVAIGGELFEPKNLTLQKGFFDSKTNTITWNKNDAPLGTIKPGDGARVVFGLATRSLLDGTGTGLNKPSIDLAATFTGIRESGDTASEPLEVKTALNLKINSVVQLLSQALYHTGPFPPSGSLPPKVGEETLYTIEWTVLNSTNDVREAKVTALLPSGIAWANAIAPTNEKVTYNPTDHTVTWDLGTLKALSLSPTGRREVAFRVGLTPSVNQVNTSPLLVTGTQFSGIDTFTQKVLNVEVPDLDIRLAKDPLFKSSTESRIVP